MPYVTFSTPESTKYIFDYLKLRRDLTLESWLFDAWTHQISKNGLIQYFERTNDKLNFGYQGRQRFFRAHALRKMFTSILYRNKFPQLTIDWFLGHRIDKTTSAYFKADIESLKNDYMEIIPELSVKETKVTTIESEGYKKIVKELERKDEELAAVHKELKGIKEALKKTEVLYEAMEDPDKISKIVKK